MILTQRDKDLVFEIAMSHVLSRDQILALGLFNSVTRVNTRMRVLRELGLLRNLETPFFRGSLYGPGPNASEVLTGRAAGLIANRQPSPRFLRHALATTEIRLALKSKGASNWQYEPMLWRVFEHAGKTLEIRPDGMAMSVKGPILVECDMGHVSPQKLGEKLKNYHQFASGGHAKRLYQIDSFNLLIVTTGKLRATHLRDLEPDRCSYGFLVQTFEELGVPLIGGWS